MRRTIFGHTPEVAPTAFIADNATLIGDVHVHGHAVIMYGAVLRADRDRIELGEGSNLQDNVSVHGDPGKPTIVGRGVSVGHAAMLHGCTIEDDCLIGMSATVLNGAVIPSGALVGANALVPEGKSFEPNALILGAPAKAVRDLGPGSPEELQKVADHYLRQTRRHRGDAVSG